VLYLSDLGLGLFEVRVDLVDRVAQQPAQVFDRATGQGDFFDIGGEVVDLLLDRVCAFRVGI
jgi:hypothetical protein